MARARARYRAAAEALERVAAEELVALSDEALLERALSLRLFANELPARVDSSGLVEQQALFQRARRA